MRWQCHEQLYLILLDVLTEVQKAIPKAKNVEQQVMTTRGLYLLSFGNESVMEAVMVSMPANCSQQLWGS